MNLTLNKGTIKLQLFEAKIILYICFDLVELIYGHHKIF